MTKKEIQLKNHLAKVKLEANLQEYQKHLILIVGGLSNIIDSMEAVNEVLPQVVNNGMINNVNNFLNSISYTLFDIKKDKRPENITDKEWLIKIEEWNVKNKQHKENVLSQYVDAIKLFNDFINEKIQLNAR
jgi:hypothetical protein